MRARRRLRCGGGSLLAVLALGCASRVVEDGRVDRQAVAQLVDSVAQLRGLEPKGRLRVALEGPAVLRERAEREARDPQRVVELTRRQAVWAKLGLIDGDADLIEAQRRLTAEAPFGYYDSSDEILRLVARRTMRSEVMELVSSVRGRDVVAGEVLAHEVCHALQDMHHDLDLLDRQAPGDDARLALRALVEGDASLVGFLYSATFFQSFGDWVRFLQRRGARAFQLDGVPDYLAQRSLFPYLAGGLFVAELYEAGGFAAIDAAYRALPPSTEVILHPERRAEPSAVPRIPVLPAVDEVQDPADEVLAEDTLGELGLRAVLARATKGAAARTAAEGWGGDRYRVVQRADGGLGLLWATRWDSEEDAEEFCQAYKRLIRSSYQPQRALQRGLRTSYLLDDQRVAAVDCAGDRVDIVETLGERLEATLDAMIAVEEDAP